MAPPSLPLLIPFSSSVHKYLLRAQEAPCQAEGDPTVSRNRPSPAPMKLAFHGRERHGSNSHTVAMISSCPRRQVGGGAQLAVPPPPPAFPADQRAAVPSPEAGGSRQVVNRQAALETELGEGLGLQSDDHRRHVASRHLCCRERSCTTFVSMNVFVSSGCVCQERKCRVMGDLC